MEGLGIQRVLMVLDRLCYSYYLYFVPIECNAKVYLFVRKLFVAVIVGI